MKLFKKYSTVSNIGNPVPVRLDGKTHWALSHPRNLTEAKRAAVQSKIADSPIVLTVGKLDEDHYCLLIENVPGCSLMPELFTTKGKAMAAFREISE